LRRFVCLVVVVFILSACSNQPNIELVEATVDISETTTVGYFPNEGESFNPNILSYKFVLANRGNESIGSIKEGIEVTLQPSDKLQRLSEEILGFNLFDDQGKNLIAAKTGEPILLPNQKGEFILDFILIELISNHEIKNASPEFLKVLRKNALDATIVVSSKGNEVARFKLSDQQ